MLGFILNLALTLLIPYYCYLSTSLSNLSRNSKSAFRCLSQVTVSAKCASLDVCFAAINSVCAVSTPSQARLSVAADSATLVTPVYNTPLCAKYMLSIYTRRLDKPISSPFSNGSSLTFFRSMVEIMFTMQHVLTHVSSERRRQPLDICTIKGA